MVMRKHLRTALLLLSASPVAAAAQSGITVGTPGNAIARTGQAAIDAFQPAIPGYYEAGQCRVYNHDASTRVAVIHYPNLQESRTSISLWFNDAGALIRYVESRGPQPAPNADLAALIAESNSVDRTSIQLDVPENRAIAMNRIDGKQGSGVRGTIEQFDASPVFSYLKDRVASVTAVCVPAGG
jgi:hypothetical protein